MDSEKEKELRDAVGMHRIISERTFNIEEELCTCFTERQKAFGSVNWTNSLQTLKGIGDLYPLPNIVRVVKSRRMRWARHVARMGEGRGVHRVLVGKPEGKRPLGRPRCRWEDNINMDLQ